MATPGAAARELRRSRREVERLWLSSAPLVGGLPVVSLAGLLDTRPLPWRRGHVTDAQKAAFALLHAGAFLLELSQPEAAAFAECLGDSATIFAPRNAGNVTRLHDNKLIAEYRRGDTAAFPARVRGRAEAAHARLDFAGRAVLRALHGTYDNINVAWPQARPIVELDSLLEPAVGKRGPAGPAAGGPSASVLTYLHYGRGAEAAPHTDRGLLTFAYASQAGLEVNLRGNGRDVWTSPPVEAHTMLVFAGECLALATGYAVHACRHRVVAGSPRRSLVMRLRANPAAALPLTFGPFWRCLSVAAFNEKFAASRSSVNEPLRTAALPSSAAQTFVQPAALSPADSVFAVSDLAAAIAAHLGDDARDLARAELVCVGLFNAVGPHWRRLCVAKATGSRSYDGESQITLPRSIVQADWRQWRALHRCMTGPMRIYVKDQDNKTTIMLVGASAPLESAFKGFCRHAGLDVHSVRFLYEGNRIGRHQTAYELRLDHATGGYVDAMMEQCGD